MNLTKIQREILRLYGSRHRSGKSELLHSKEAALLLSTSKDVVNEELSKLEVMGLLAVQKAFHEDYSAYITGAGLRILDEIGPISDKT